MTERKSSPTLKEQLVRAVVNTAVALDRGPTEVQPVRDQVIRMVDQFLAATVAAHIVPEKRTGFQADCLGEITPTSPNGVGFDEPWEEGIGHVPWYAG
jgi:hypothetical protein